MVLEFFIRLVISIKGNSKTSFPPLIGRKETPV